MKATFKLPIERIVILELKESEAVNLYELTGNLHTASVKQAATDSGASHDELLYLTNDLYETLGELLHR